MKTCSKTKSLAAASMPGIMVVWINLRRLPDLTTKAKRCEVPELSAKYQSTDEDRKDQG